MSEPLLRILFVDDQAAVLDGLQDMLRKKRKLWEMQFVASGDAALEELARSPYDVVVSDMRMPGMDGARLLGEVRARHPHVVRIVLSGYSEIHEALRVVPVAHQFLAKPCKAEVLVQALERAHALRSLVQQPELRAMLGRIQHLPAAPASHLKLMKLVDDDEASARSIACVLEEDVGMCAKLLQLVNSPFFGTQTRVSSVEQAVLRLGINIVRALALGVEVFESDVPIEHEGLWSAVHRHSFATAELARRIHIDRAQAGEAFLAGFLHEVGMLVIAANLAPVDEAVPGRSQRVHVAGREVILDEGAAHAAIGAYLLGLWGFDFGLVQSLAYLHTPSHCPGEPTALLVSLHAADVLSQQADPSLRLEDHTLDSAFLERAGVLDELPSWTTAASELHEKAHGQS